MNILSFHAIIKVQDRYYIYYVKRIYNIKVFLCNVKSFIRQNVLIVKIKLLLTLAESDPYTSKFLVMLFEGVSV